MSPSTLSWISQKHPERGLPWKRDVLRTTGVPVRTPLAGFVWKDAQGWKDDLIPLLQGRASDHHALGCKDPAHKDRSITRLQQIVLLRYQHTCVGFLVVKPHNFTGPFTTIWDISLRNYTLQHFCVFVTTEYPCANIRIYKISTKITLLKFVLLVQNIERMSFDSQKIL